MTLELSDSTKACIGVLEHVKELRTSCKTLEDNNDVRAMQFTDTSMLEVLSTKLNAALSLNAACSILEKKIVLERAEECL